ncbi:velvet factor-domain-containing protein [Mycena leptocephala]|nr:velvet factor-domain-containing protein [Mycena leptocephala]
MDGAHLKYDVTIRQQPQHARISAMKISDRRPVDPPIIVQLSVTDPGTLVHPIRRPPGIPITRHSHLTNPYYFMYAALVEAHNDTEVKYVCDGGSPSTSGALVSSIRVLKDHPNTDQDAAFFIFPNICVRLEGSWRFKLSLFVIDGQVKLCATTFSAPFFVYQGKQYPGVQASTPLTRALAAQGVKLRIRKDIRAKAFFDSQSGLFNLLEITAKTEAHADEPGRQLAFQPSPVSFFAPEKMSQYDAHLRRASLDAQTLQRPYQSREWLTPRVLEEYQHNLLPPFAIPTKPSLNTRNGG